jgi:outer membrane protein TolC
MEPNTHCFQGHVRITHILRALLMASIFSTYSLRVVAEIPTAIEPSAQLSLRLEDAINITQTQDDWLVKSHIEQQRLLALSEGANALPDPVFSIGVLNLPTDGFAFDQEPMTQVKVAASQMFPRGDTLSLQVAKLKATADIHPAQRQDRRQKMALQATLLWLEAYQNQASLMLVKKAQPLFEKLQDSVRSRYASSVKKNHQQDVIQAELELLKLQERFITLETKQRVALSNLKQFLRVSDSTSHPNYTIVHNFNTVGSLPEKQSFLSEDVGALLGSAAIDENTLYTSIMNHPLLVAIEQKVAAQRIEVDIAKQGYEPQFGVNASYAVRNDTPEGQSRADFFSIGLSVSLPLFSQAQQDAQVSSSVAQVEGTKTQKRLVLSELMTGLDSSIKQYQGALHRLAIYEREILPKMSQQADVAINAYSNDTGDFTEVVRAKIDALNANIAAIQIQVEMRKALANMQYFLSTYQMNEVHNNLSKLAYEGVHYDK